MANLDSAMPRYP